MRPDRKEKKKKSTFRQANINDHDVFFMLITFSMHKAVERGEMLQDYFSEMKTGCDKVAQAQVR